MAFFLRDKVDVDVYFAYHSYSQYFMLPYGYTSEEAADYSELVSDDTKVCGTIQVNIIC